MTNAHATALGILALVSRALLALIFLVMGGRHLVHRSRVAANMAAHGMPFTRALIVCTILIEILGGALLLIGFHARWSAAALALFTIAATIVFYRNISDGEHLVHLLKNLAIVGGLLMAACYGPGLISLDGGN